MGNARHQGRPFHQTTIARVENGTRPTSVEEVFALAAVLDVPVTDLLTENTDRQLVRLSVEVDRRRPSLLNASRQHKPRCRRPGS